MGSTFRGISPFASWETMSPDNNPWSTGATAGAIVGFSVFALSYLYVVVYIFYDINRSKISYAEQVEEDLDTIKKLNVPPNMWAEWQAELAAKLEGKNLEDKADDQLFGAAANLSPAEWQKEM